MTIDQNPGDSGCDFRVQLRRGKEKLNEAFNARSWNEYDSIRDGLIDTIQKFLDERDSCKGEDLDSIFAFIEKVQDDYISSKKFDSLTSILEKLWAQKNERAGMYLAHLHSNHVFRTDTQHIRFSRGYLIYERLKRAEDDYVRAYAHSRLAEMQYARNKGRDDETEEEKNRRIKDLQKMLQHLGYAALDCKFPLAMAMLAELSHEPWCKIGKQESFDARTIFEEAYKIVSGPFWQDKWVKKEIEYRYGIFLLSQSPEYHRTGEDMILSAADNYHAAAVDWAINAAREKENSDKEEDSSASPMGYFTGGKKKSKEKPVRKISKKKAEEALEPLRQMIGCGEAKRQIEKIFYTALADNLRRSRKAPIKIKQNYHTAFVGSPGTGKTTVARMYGKILHELGVLESGHVVEVSRADLVGQYVGHTERHVREKVRKAAGGILFIDEAYMLNSNSYVDFGQEAIAELMIQMENRDDFVVIFAGYPDHMNMFLKMNPGLQSRVPHIVSFDDYTAEELAEILEGMSTEAGLILSAEAKAYVQKKIFAKEKETIRRMGNARAMRTILQQAAAEQSKRIVLGKLKRKKDLMTLMPEDFFFLDENGKGPFKVVK